MRNSAVTTTAAFIALLGLSPIDAVAAPTTAEFMNAMTVCGAGSSVKIDANLQGSLKSLYEGEATQGKAVQEIMPKIADQLPQGDNYQRYVDCLDKLLSR